MLTLKDYNPVGPTLWTTHIKTILSDIEMQTTWESQSPEFISQNWSKIMEALNHKSVVHDHRRIQSSSSSRLIHWKKNVGVEPYLFSAAMKVRQTWSQLRLASPIFPSIVGVGNLRHKLDPAQDCEVCNLRSSDTIDHFLIVCPQYDSNRRRFLNQHLTNILLRAENTIHTSTVSPTTISPNNISPTPLLRILDSASETIMTDMFYYVISSLRIRSFVLDL